MFTLQRSNAPVWETDEIEPANVRETDTPHSGRTVSGYGSKLPTPYMIRIGSRWYRVYVACYSNAGSAYVTVAGERRLVNKY